MFEHISRWELLVRAGARLYLFTLMDNDVESTIDLLAGLVSTIELHPEDAADQPSIVPAP